jgi:transcriptional regulator GlxA family with amidase domain
MIKISFTLVTILSLSAMTFGEAPQPMQVGFLALDKVYNSELMAPYDVFQHTIFHTKPGMNVFTVSLDGKMITTFEGIRLTTDFSIQNAPPIDVLVIPSAEHSMDSDLKNEPLKKWVLKIATSAKYIVTLCDGAFVLANTGLLNGKSATTFPTDVDRFKTMFPQIKTLENFSFVQDGKFLTSQGGAKSYDVALYLVDLLYGEKVAAGIGRGLVIQWKIPDLKYFVAP